MALHRLSGTPACQFGHGVHASGFQQFGVLRADAVDTVQVDHVGEFQNLLAGETRLASQ